MQSIPLPPLPGWVYLTAEMESDQRARDLAVAKAVLEAAGVAAWRHYMDTCKKRKLAPANFEEWLAATAIRALRFHHE